MRLKKLNPLNFYYILCNILTKFLINDLIYKVSASNKIYCRSASGANATMCKKYTLNHFEYFKNRDLSHSRLPHVYTQQGSFGAISCLADKRV